MKLRTSLAVRDAEVRSLSEQLATDRQEVRTLSRQLEAARLELSERNRQLEAQQLPERTSIAERKEQLAEVQSTPAETPLRLSVEVTPIAPNRERVRSVHFQDRVSVSEISEPPDPNE